MVGEQVLNALSTLVNGAGSKSQVYSYLHAYLSKNESSTQ